MGIVEGMNGLRDIIPELDKRFRYAVEVRDSSWFQDLNTPSRFNIEYPIYYLEIIIKSNKTNYRK